MDIAQAFAAAEGLSFGGRDFAVRQLRLSEWAGLTAYLKTHYRSPVTEAVKALAEARGQGLDVDQDLADLVTSAALTAARHWPPRVGSLAWLRALDTVEGGTAHFVRTVLAAGGAELDQDDAHALAERATQDEFDALVRLAYFGDPPRPKAPTPAADQGPTAGPDPTASPTTGGRFSTSSPKRAGRTKTSAG